MELSTPEQKYISEAASGLGIYGPMGKACAFRLYRNRNRANMLLTAGHWLQPGSNYKVQYKNTHSLRQVLPCLDYTSHRFGQATVSL
jgi:hypothetical protein